MWLRAGPLIAAIRAGLDGSLLPLSLLLIRLEVDDCKAQWLIPEDISTGFPIRMEIFLVPGVLCVKSGGEDPT